MAGMQKNGDWTAKRKTKQTNKLSWLRRQPATKHSDLISVYTWNRKHIFFFFFSRGKNTTRVVYIECHFAHQYSQNTIASKSEEGCRIDRRILLRWKFPSWKCFGKRAMMSIQNLSREKKLSNRRAARPAALRERNTSLKALSFRQSSVLLFRPFAHKLFRLFHPGLPVFFEELQRDKTVNVLWPSAHVALYQNGREKKLLLHSGNDFTSTFPERNDGVVDCIVDPVPTSVFVALLNPTTTIH
jgi:hypothetical protein